MKIHSVAGSPYEDNEGDVINLWIELYNGEQIAVGDRISIEMMDGSFLDREVKIIAPKYAGDYAVVSEKARNSGWARSDAPITKKSGPCLCDVVVMHVPYHEVKTEQEIALRKWEKEMESRCCITPYVELRCGDESIYDYVRKDYSVPDKVIKYLQTQKLYYMCPGIYQHPFREGVRLLGPYVYTDGYYYWDRDTWKYVLKYGLVLPQEFVDHVMSDDCTAFIEEYYGKTWRLEERENLLNLLPDDHGDVDLNDF